MSRRLPRAHPDDEDAVRKLRLRTFKLLYQAYYEWQALRGTGHTVQDVLMAPNGEEVYFPDLMTGYNYLPRRQQQSFELICMRGYSEAAATIEIYGVGECETDSEGNPVLDAEGNPVIKKRSSTVVQQYAQQALERMVQAYDEVQANAWDPIAVMNSRKLNGREIAHDPVAARRRRLEAGGGGQRATGDSPGDVYDDRREDRVPDRRTDGAAFGPRGVQRVRTG